jgi:uncharacterized protein (TIGR04255 family)
MAQNNVTIAYPPVVETVLSVQFSSLPGYTSAHAGWFWKDYVQKLSTEAWPTISQAPRIEDHFERFGAEDVWTPFSLKVFPAPQTARIQLLRADGERMIQVQDTRFILNWRKQSAAYPSYDALLPEFARMLSAFEAFTVEAGMKTPEYNQWELAYVNQLKKGELWNSVRDWTKVFPAFAMPPLELKNAPISNDETMSADWRFSLAGERGRMYVSLRHVKVPPNQEEMMQVTMTARGGVNQVNSWESGFTLGHAALNEAFTQLSSVEAQQRWKRGA